MWLVLDISCISDHLKFDTTRNFQTHTGASVKIAPIKVWATT